MATASGATRAPSIFGPGLMLGFGLGGFVDGIVVHQILQWHHVISNSGRDRLSLHPHPSNTLAGLQKNTLWDGLFHASTWVLVTVGLLWLWRRVTADRGPWSRSSLVGLLLAGWGGFNLIEGLVNHQLLAIHHVRPGEYQLAFDLGFLVLGLLLVLAGAGIHRAVQRRLASVSVVPQA